MEAGILHSDGSPDQYRLLIADHRKMLAGASCQPRDLESNENGAAISHSVKAWARPAPTSTPKAVVVSSGYHRLQAGIVYSHNYNRQIAAGPVVRSANKFPDC
jgi:hypothetical protein